MSISIWVVILLYIPKRNSVEVAIQTNYRYQHACDVIAPDAPSQEVGYWDRITLQLARLFLDPPQGFLLEILTTRIVQTVIIGLDMILDVART